MGPSIEIKSSYIYPNDLLQVVRAFGEHFRTGKDLPNVQPDQVEKAQQALRNVALQLKWWPRTCELAISQHFEFMAEAMDKDGFISKGKVCCAHERQAVIELTKAGVLRYEKTGWREQGI